MAHSSPHKGFRTAPQHVPSARSEAEKARYVFLTLKSAERAVQDNALPMLKGLVGLVRSERGQPLEVDEARSSAFLSICAVGKALHRGEAAGPLWTAAIAATERWMALAKPMRMPLDCLDPAHSSVALPDSSRSV